MHLSSGTFSRERERETVSGKLVLKESFHNKELVSRNLLGDSRFGNFDFSQ